MSDASISHHPESDARGTFDLEIAGKRMGFLSYSLDAKTIVIDYVQVDPSLRGKGLGEQLVRAAVEWARTSNRKVVPICSYARALMKRPKAFLDVLEL